MVKLFHSAHRCFSYLRTLTNVSRNLYVLIKSPSAQKACSLRTPPAHTNNLGPNDSEDLLSLIGWSNQSSDTLFESIGNLAHAWLFYRNRSPE